MRARAKHARGYIGARGSQGRRGGLAGDGSGTSPDPIPPSRAPMPIDIAIRTRRDPLEGVPSAAVIRGSFGLVVPEGGGGGEGEGGSCTMHLPRKEGPAPHGKTRGTSGELPPDKKKGALRPCTHIVLTACLCCEEARLSKDVLRFGVVPRDGVGPAVEDIGPVQGKGAS